MMKQPSIAQFLNEEGQVVAWPTKQAKKTSVLAYIATKFERGRFYTEREVNQLIDRWHTFGDLFLIRRELVEAGLVARTRNGAKYWVEELTETEDDHRAPVE